MAERSISPRDLRIAALVAEGWKDKQIAQELGMSYDYARLRLRILSRRIGANNRAMVAAWYVRRTEASR